MMTRDELYESLKEALSTDFGIDKEKVSLDSNLVEDFDLDSIDAADLIVKYKEYLPAKVDAGMFRSIRTVRDVLDLLCPRDKQA
ncbi:MAG: acyl carrier protein [Sphaerochaetaceae bacterium]|nr:acyl carrier protein [Spirochaetales bacterium]MDY5499100.1 acyl carrier protein [Sphaerochaetaceae bacterium]